MKKQAAKEITLGILISAVLWIFGIIFSGKYILTEFVGAYKLYYLILLFPVLVFAAFVFAGRISATVFSGRLLTASIVTLAFVAVVGPLKSCADTLTAIFEKYIINDNIPLLAYIYLCVPMIAGVVLAVRMANKR